MNELQINWLFFILNWFVFLLNCMLFFAARHYVERFLKAWDTLHNMEHQIRKYRHMGVSEDGVC